jgi:hypothetical protein
MNVLQILNRYHVRYEHNHPNQTEGWVGAWRCPYCQKPDYHLGINLKSGGFKCWVCGEKGWIAKLMEKFGVAEDELQLIRQSFEPFIISRDEIKSKYNKESKERRTALRLIPGTHPVPPMAMAKLKAYLELRKIIEPGDNLDDTMIAVHRYNLFIGTGANWEGRISAPIEQFKDGQVIDVGAVGRSTNDEKRKYLYEEGTQMTKGFIGLSFLHKYLFTNPETDEYSEGIIIPIVEGMFDVLSLCEPYGDSLIDTVVCPLGIGGSHMSDQQQLQLGVIITALLDTNQGKRSPIFVPVALDRDKYDENVKIVSSLRLILPDKVKVFPVKWPQGVPDPNDYMTHNKDDGISCALLDFYDGWKAIEDVTKLER